MRENFLFKSKIHFLSYIFHFSCSIFSQLENCCLHSCPLKWDENCEICLKRQKSIIDSNCRAAKGTILRRNKKMSGEWRAKNEKLGHEKNKMIAEKKICFPLFFCEQNSHSGKKCLFQYHPHAVKSLKRNIHIHIWDICLLEWNSNNIRKKKNYLLFFSERKILKLFWVKLIFRNIKLLLKYEKIMVERKTSCVEVSLICVLCRKTNNLLCIIWKDIFFSLTVSINNKMLHTLNWFICDKGRSVYSHRVQMYLCTMYFHFIIIFCFSSTKKKRS